MTLTASGTSTANNPRDSQIFQASNAVRTAIQMRNVLYLNTVSVYTWNACVLWE